MVKFLSWWWRIHSASIQRSSSKLWKAGDTLSAFEICISDDPNLCHPCLSLSLPHTPDIPVKTRNSSEVLERSRFPERAEMRIPEPGCFGSRQDLLVEALYYLSLTDINLAFCKEMLWPEVDKLLVCCKPPCQIQTRKLRYRYSRVYHNHLSHQVIVLISGRPADSRRTAMGKQAES